jgi:hypothetical protein
MALTCEGPLQHLLPGLLQTRIAFPGVGGTPSTDDSIVLTSLRYYPI